MSRPPPPPRSNTRRPAHPPTTYATKRIHSQARERRRGGAVARPLQLNTAQAIDLGEDCDDHARLHDVGASTSPSR